MAKKETALTTASSALAPAPQFIPTGRAGFENVDPNDVMFERLTLMQDLSPAVKDKKFNAGDIVRKSTEEVIYSPGSAPVLFTLVYYFKEYVEFGDRDEPSQPVVIARSTDRSSALAEEARAWTKKKRADGRLVRKVTDVHNFIILLNGRPLEPMLVSCMRANAKHGTGLLSLANSRGNYPLHAGAYTLVSEEERNKKNQSYWSLRFRNAVDNPWSSEAMFKEAEKLSKLLADMAKGGRLGGDYSKDDIAVTDDGQPAVNANSNAKVPY